MPHDVKNNLLSVGDEVLVRCKVTALCEGEDYCNVTMESVHGRRPDGLKETLYSINTGVVEKA
jgi:hypothetical protein